MLHLEMTDEEHQLLTNMLDEYLSDLRMEIADTDSLEYKEGLRHRKQVAQQLSEKLRRTQREVPA